MREAAGRHPFWRSEQPRACPFLGFTLALRARGQGTLKQYYSRVTSPGTVSCLEYWGNLKILASQGKKELFCEPRKGSSKTRVCLCCHLVCWYPCPTTSWTHSNLMGIFFPGSNIIPFIHPSPTFVLSDTTVSHSLDHMIKGILLS